VCYISGENNGFSKHKKMSLEKRQNLITIVSGLPRSGTSMMMQMLNAGGMEVLTDNLREADQNNVKGYFEYEKVKTLNDDNSWIENAEGTAIKVISQLLPHLPNGFDYKIIFMERDLGEILKSQEKMLENLGKKEEGGNPDILKKAFRNHLEKVKKWLADQGNMDVIYISYREAVQHPLEQATLISDFLDSDLSPEEMAAVVDTSLYRQRNR
jgi:hypothetical protein